MGPRAGACAKGTAVAIADRGRLPIFAHVGRATDRWAAFFFPSRNRFVTRTNLSAQVFRRSHTLPDGHTQHEKRVNIPILQGGKRGPVADDAADAVADDAHSNSRCSDSLH